MKKQEALDFIEAELAKGTPKEEIVKALLEQGKIGNSKPTESIIDGLFDLIDTSDPDEEEQGREEGENEHFEQREHGGEVDDAESREMNRENEHFEQ